MMSKKCKIILVILLVVLILIGFIVYYIRNYAPQIIMWLVNFFEKEKTESLGEEIFDKIGTDPMENMPQTNPFETKLNPFE